MHIEKDPYKDRFTNLATRLLKEILRFFGLQILRIGSVDRILDSERARARADIEFILKMPGGSHEGLLKYLGQSQSQLHQDLFVISELNFKRNGFFVEFGATNGIDISNSLLLETEFGWTGILAEPARFWHEDIKRNRAAFIEEKCVWVDSTSKLVFNETANPELSTIAAFSDLGMHSQSRKAGKEYSVDTISLIDLLVKYKAPKYIDYLSIDTEGSEYSILSSFDFDRFTFGVITCEHAYLPQRELIYELLTAKGYVRKYPELSAFDDWYVRRSR